jgi:thioredoxin-like negative regulator of GroEL
VTDATNAPLDAQAIQAWATNPDNRERALKLGYRLITAKRSEDLEELESLGEFEDRATQWAVNNQMKAKLLVMRVIGMLKPTGEEIEKAKG